MNLKSAAKWRWVLMKNNEDGAESEHDRADAAANAQMEAEATAAAMAVRSAWPAGLWPLQSSMGLGHDLEPDPEPECDAKLGTDHRASQSQTRTRAEPESEHEPEPEKNPSQNPSRPEPGQPNPSQIKGSLSLPPKVPRDTRSLRFSDTAPATMPVSTGDWDALEASIGAKLQKWMEDSSAKANATPAAVGVMEVTSQSRRTKRSTQV